MNSFIQQGCIKLTESVSKYIYNLTKKVSQFPQTY